MKHKKKKHNYERRGYEIQSHVPFEHRKKKKFSTGMKLLSAFLSIAVIGGFFYWQSTLNSKPSTAQQYPSLVAGSTYLSPTIESNGTKVSVPYTYVDSKKLVFLDLKLERTTNEIRYQGRSIPLSLYKAGQYLPVVIISTPTQKVISGIRVCEPCGSFSFHIIDGRYLDCDSCHTKWDIETLSGVSGGCPNYPPPRLTNAISNDVVIDLSQLGMRVT